MKVLKVVTFKGNHPKQLEKTYTATDQKDASEMFDHWYEEAKHGDGVAIISTDGKKEFAIRIKVKGDLNKL